MRSIFVKKAFRFILLGIGLGMLPGACPAQTATVTIQANEPSAIISSNLFGIFFEEISMAGDGGIYAELIRNRSFEDAGTPVQWTLLTNGTATGAWAINTAQPLSSTNRQALQLTMTGGTGSLGAANNGFFGIPLASGQQYNLGFYARADAGFAGSIAVSLEGTNGGAAYAQSAVNGLTTNWQHFALSLSPNTTDPAARLVLRMAQPGTIYLDFVSLFPAQTFHNRTNGLRPDLAKMLADIKPSFMRFPGGSWVDGTSLANAYHWEATIGDPANRTERTNVWGYMVSNGLGYYEYLQLCEDLGVQPLFCINCGMDVSQNAIPTNQLGSWVQEALDAIQYANGDTNTTWGAQRAAAGHPAPFNLQYIEIGNENNGSAYNANYGLFYKAIKAAYPNLHIIADSFGTVPTSAPVEMVDEHHYQSASWFAQNSSLYDNYPRSGPKIFVGEYAVAYSIPPATFPATLQNALGEAAWMTGLERNSDLVQMACYAPLFCNLNFPSWYPDLIYFNGTNVFGSPSYYVQQMFSLNRGNEVLPATVAGGGNPLYVSASLVESSGQVIIKAVNFSNSSQPTTFNLNGVTSVAPSATVVQLTGDASAENSFTAPTAVFPTTNVLGNAGTNFTVTLPANSLTIFRLQGNGFNQVTNLQLELQSPLQVGQEAVAGVMGTTAGQALSLAGNRAVVFASADTNVAVVNADGLVIGAGVGATAITAAYNGSVATQMVQVAAAPATRLIHRYSFNDGTANDSVGTANGIFHNASGLSSIANGLLNLAGSTGDYVDLGADMITTTNITTGAITLEAWATFNPVNGAWARLFDFGNISGSSGGNYIFLAANDAANGGNCRLAVTDTMPGNSGESGLDIPNLLGETNMYVAVVFNPTPGRQFLGLYTNGVLAASAPTGGKYIASIDDAFSFLGHSLWSGDAGLNGSINEFRVYDGELNEFQIAASYQAGPDTTNYSVGAPTGLSLGVGGLPLWVNESASVTARLNFTLASKVNVLGDPGLALSSDNTNVFTVNAAGMIQATGIGTATLTGVYAYIENNTTAYFTNSVAIAVRNQPASLAHRYSFTSDASDSVGGAAWNGTLPNGGTFANGQVELAASSSQYVQLPAGMLSNYTAVTIEAWVTFPDQLPVNCFFYGFGNTDGSGSGEDYIFCAPQGGRIAITGADPGWQGEQNAGGIGDLSYHTNLHFVAVCDPPAGYLALYTNGVLATENTAVTVPLTSVNDALNYIGRSLYSADPYPDLDVDEFRIYNGALQVNQIAATDVLGPNQLLSSASPALTAQETPGGLSLDWPLTAAGFTLVAATNLTAGSWAALAPAQQIVNGQWQITLPAPEQAQFFRLEE